MSYDIPCLYDLWSSFYTCNKQTGCVNNITRALNMYKLAFSGTKAKNTNVGGQEITAAPKFTATDKTGPNIESLYDSPTE